MTLPARRHPPIAAVIACATLLMGTLDVSDALMFYGLRGVSVERLLQSIATGLVGSSAFKGGMPMALLGLGCHFFIAFTVTAIYLVASCKIALFRHPLLYGIFYGLVVYGVMNYIVVPLSKAAHRPPFPPLVPFVNGVLAIVVCIGIPLGFIANRYIAHPGGPA